MERYTGNQVKRALTQEQLLKRLDQGEDFQTLLQELRLSLSHNYLSELRHRYRQRGSSWEALIDHRQGHAYKATLECRDWLRERKRENLTLTQQALTGLYATEFQTTISQTCISKVLREEGVAIPGGKHLRSQGQPALPVERAGVFFPPSRRPPDGPPEHGHPGDPGTEGHLPGD